MRSKQLVQTTGFNESKEEAKNPGAILGLIMGIYPALLVVGLLVAIAFLGLRGGNPAAAPTVNPSKGEVKVQTTVSPDINAPVQGTQ